MSEKVKSITVQLGLRDEFSKTARQSLALVESARQAAARIEEAMQGTSDTLRKVAMSIAYTGRYSAQQAEELLCDLAYYTPLLDIDFDAIQHEMAQYAEPMNERQYAQQRSRADVHRKSRPGRYKWGGKADE